MIGPSRGTGLFVLNYLGYQILPRSMIDREAVLILSLLVLSSISSVVCVVLLLLQLCDYRSALETLPLCSSTCGALGSSRCDARVPNQAYDAGGAGLNLTGAATTLVVGAVKLWDGNFCLLAETI